MIPAGPALHIGPSKCKGRGLFHPFKYRQGGTELLIFVLAPHIFPLLWANWGQIHLLLISTGYLIAKSDK